MGGQMIMLGRYEIGTSSKALSSTRVGLTLKTRDGTFIRCFELDEGTTQPTGWTAHGPEALYANTTSLEKAKEMVFDDAISNVRALLEASPEFQVRFDVFLREELGIREDE